MFRQHAALLSESVLTCHRWSTGLSIIAFLISLMYCTEIGFYLLDAIDTNTNNFGLLFIVAMECMSTTILYR